jgi:hypothetical protein
VGIDLADRAVMRISLALVLVACGDSSIATPADAPVDELVGWTLGPRGQAGFALEYGPPSRAIAERARADIVVAVRSTAPPVATVTTDDTSILMIEKLTRGSNQIFTVDLGAPSAGDTDVVLRDAAGAEIDRMTFHVRATDVLDLRRPWGAGDALVLAGEVERMHVTTTAAGVASAGTGAVQFTLAGDLSTTTSDQAPWLFSEGDEVFFRTAAGGSGSITASAPNATTTVTIQVVPPTSLTALAANPSSLDAPSNRAGVVAIGALSGSAPVYGARCTWSDVEQLTIALKPLLVDLSDLSNLGEQTGWIGSNPVFLYSISGPPGIYHPTCTIGGLTTTISVRIR